MDQKSDSVTVFAINAGDGRARSDGIGIEAGSPLFFCFTVKTVAPLIFLQHIPSVCGIAVFNRSTG